MHSDACVKDGLQAKHGPNSAGSQKRQDPRQVHVILVSGVHGTLERTVSPEGEGDGEGRGWGQGR